MVDLNDSVKLVQVHPGNGVVIVEKQIGVLHGMYRDKPSDTVTIGAGRCHLIKGDYYYFAITYKKDLPPQANDLLYLVQEKPDVFTGRLLKLATHFIGLQDVYEDPYYDRYGIFSDWSAAKEASVLDSMLADIRFTGDYFLKNNPAMNVKIQGGQYDGKMVFDIMIKSTTRDIVDFLDYMEARPRFYAGKEWKIAEIFATWLSGGSPTVIKD